MYYILYDLLAVGEPCFSYTNITRIQFECLKESKFHMPTQHHTNLKTKCLERKFFFCDSFGQILPILKSIGYKNSISVFLLELGCHWVWLSTSLWLVGGKRCIIFIPWSCNISPMGKHSAQESLRTLATQCCNTKCMSPSLHTQWEDNR